MPGLSRAAEETGTLEDVHPGVLDGMAARLREGAGAVQDEGVELLTKGLSARLEVFHRARGRRCVVCRAGSPSHGQKVMPAAQLGNVHEPERPLTSGKHA